MPADDNHTAILSAWFEQWRPQWRTPCPQTPDQLGSREHAQHRPIDRCEQHERNARERLAQRWRT